jgi:AcrR family transcriptional regulator
MNDKKRGRPSKENNQLSSDIILESAKKLLLAEKKIPSIRKVALELNIDPMSIYYYFPNKNNLLESITISLMQEIYEPNNSNNWKKELVLLSKSYLTLLSKYPGLLETMLKMESLGPSNEFTNHLENILLPLKLDKERFESVLCLLVDYLHGVALAIQCDSKNKLSIKHIENPLNLLIESIE